MKRDEIEEWITIYRDGLLSDVVPFWQRHSPDREHGGFLTLLDADGSVVGTDKPVWIQGRATWPTASPATAGRCGSGAICSASPSPSSRSQSSVNQPAMGLPSSARMTSSA